SIGYKRFVQDPVIDKYCIKCHGDPENKAYQTINMTYRPSTHPWRGWVHHRPDDVSPFTEPYLTFVNGATPWGGAKKRDEHNVPENIAGLFIVEAYGANDPDNLKTLPPYSAYSPVSRLVHNACSGEHHGVKIAPEDAERLMAWVDCNGPYLGDEEIRAMYDPESVAVSTAPKIRPRIATAPVINRFNIRQDGDTSAFLPELKLLPNPDLKYDPNKAVYEEQVKEYEAEKATIKVELVSATYGAGDTQADVLPKLKESFSGARLIPLPNSRYNDVFGDPARNVVKKLRVQYKINGGDVKTVEFAENARIILPL
ncbi:MAG: hypothetical protein IIY32_09110, partial [Thermoguttaceae bacterium]|nr:hypothetical protein [Thermoguttaceae bacterium]